MDLNHVFIPMNRKVVQKKCDCYVNEYKQLIYTTFSN